MIHFAPSALLQAPAGAPGGIASFLPLVFQFGAIFLIFYFIMIRPQQKQRKDHEARLRELKRGDEVVTAGGIVGKVVHIKETTKDGKAERSMDDHITITSSESRLIVERGKIARVLTPGVPAGKATSESSAST